MATKEGNKRITITLSKELDDKLELLSKYKGIPKAIEATNLISATIDAQIALFENLNNPEFMSNLIKFADLNGDPETIKGAQDLAKVFSNQRVPGLKSLEETKQVMTKLKSKKK